MRLSASGLKPLLYDLLRKKEGTTSSIVHPLKLSLLLADMEVKEEKGMANEHMFQVSTRNDSFTTNAVDRYLSIPILSDYGTIEDIYRVGNTRIV
jgi:hypothetical protein